MAQNDQKKNISDETSITSQEMKEMERQAKDEDDDCPLVPKEEGYIRLYTF